MACCKDDPFHFTLGTEAVYRIIVYGRLDGRWSAQLGLNVNYVTVREKITQSTLSGCFQDQAALFGVLNGLYGLGFPLLSVECIR